VNRRSYKAFEKESRLVSASDNEWGLRITC
jgi:hypothetical protein